MTAKLVLVVFVVLGLLWTVAWAWVLLQSRQKAAYEDVYPKVSALRRRLFYAVAAIGIVVTLVSMAGLPYRPVRSISIGKPQVTVEVAARQWAWAFSQREMPVGVPVVFNVTSLDVNHGFGLYNPQGELVAQVQSMPGYTNPLVYQFSAPGTYSVRCLELCGIAHHVMVATLAVR